jgi:predicted aspartyl protease
MPAYDADRFEPPAPVARVILRRQGQGQVETLMLIDSGADVTLLPRGAVESLGVPVETDRRYSLIGFDGTVSLSPVVRLELTFCGRTYRGQFLLVDEECGILGRNILNSVALVLDGPRQTWDETHPSSSAPTTS